MLACHEAYYNATSDDALATRVCAVCARRSFLQKDGVTEHFVSHIPSRERLRPIESNPFHDLTDGLLLEPSGLFEGPNGERKAYLCDSCLQHLCSKKMTRPPPLSLAN